MGLCKVSSVLFEETRVGDLDMAVLCVLAVTGIAFREYLHIEIENRRQQEWQRRKDSQKTGSE